MYIIFSFNLSETYVTNSPLSKDYIKVKVKVKVRVLSLDPKLALTTSQFYLAGHWKWPHSYILSFTGSGFNAPQGLHFLSAPH